MQTNTDQRTRLSLTDSLFFALYPDEAAIEQISELTSRLRTEHRLKAKPIPTDRLHVTLHYLGAFAGLPADVVNRACDTASRMKLPPCDIALNRIETFSARRAKRPLVLAGDANQALYALQDAITDTKSRAHFTPHVTLLYDEHRVPRQAVESITWTANHFALVHSFLGRSHHEILARWPLSA